LAELIRKKFHRAGFAEKAIDAELLKQARGQQRELEARRVRKDVEEHPAHEAALEAIGGRTVGAGRVAGEAGEVGASFLDQFVIHDAAGAGGLAAAAVEAEVEMVAD